MRGEIGGEMGGDGWMVMDAGVGRRMDKQFVERSGVKMHGGMV